MINGAFPIYVVNSLTDAIKSPIKARIIMVHVVVINGGPLSRLCCLYRLSTLAVNWTNYQ